MTNSCGNPYAFGTVGGPRNNLIPDTPLQENDVDIMVDEVTGIDRENVFPVYKDVDHLDHMQEAMAGSRNVVVIGGGFIGVEMSDEINKMQDRQVTICELLPHCLQPAFAWGRPVQSGWTGPCLFGTKRESVGTRWPARASSTR